MQKLSFFVFMSLLIPTLARAGERVLFMGDSITDGGWGNSGGAIKSSAERTHWDMNHIYGHGYMFLCAAHYQGHYPAQEYQFFNRGIAGDSLADMEKRWEMDALALKPDILSILIGTNDINVFLSQNKASFDIQDWGRRYRQLLDRARAANPNLKLILGAPFVAKTGTMRVTKDYAKREAAINLCIHEVKAMAKEYQALYLPFDELFRDLMAHSQSLPDTYWIWDGIHPTAAGHQRMADLWIQAVDEAKWLKR